jgi:hypothetical protein
MTDPESPAAAARAWLRPGFVDLLGVSLVVLVVSIGGHRLFADADAATHVATGTWILEHRRVPVTDPFSGTRPGAEWFAHEWLADVGMAILYRAFGWSGLVAAAALLITLPHVLLFRFLVRRGDDVLAAFGAVVAAAATASSHWLARPHLLTVVFLVLFAIILERVVSGRSGIPLLLWLPALTLLWANIHGGFIMIFGVLACYVFGVALDLPGSASSRPTGWAPARSVLLPLIVTSLVCAAGVFVNPWGWRLPWHLVTFFGRRGPALAATSEFAPATVGDRAGVALVAFTILCVAGIACGLRTAHLKRPPARGETDSAARRRLGPFHPGTLIALALTTAMAFRSIRDVEVMAVFGTLIISGGFSAFLRPRLDREMRDYLAALGAREASCGGALAAAAVAAVWVLAWSGLLPRAGFDPALFPVKAVATLKEEGVAPSGPVFAPDIWGGYLILEWPQARVFVDGRWDMYGDEFFRRYADIYLARPGWSELLAAAGVNLAILPRDAPLVEEMRASPEWVRRSADETAIVFESRMQPLAR